MSNNNTNNNNDNDEKIIFLKTRKFNKSKDKTEKVNKPKKAKNASNLKAKSMVDIINEARKYNKGNQKKYEKKVPEVLENVFGFSDLKPFQKSVMDIVFTDQDVLILSPTGSGKSLCYQLPALINEGITLILSPLKSLIYDQVAKMRSLNIRIAVLTGDICMKQKKEYLDMLLKWNQEAKQKKVAVPYNMIYTTPEMIMHNERFNEVLKRLYHDNQLSRIVVDEAHCVSIWGHDFRDSYLLLGELKLKYPKTPLMALTATATPKVKKDIIHLLKIPSCYTLSSSFRRHNLVLQIRDKSRQSINEIQEMLVTQFANQSGIIYCYSKKECEKVANQLKDYTSVNYYHAGIGDAKRKEVQQSWIDNETRVIVATVAFGMGVDKPDVRFVIHYNLPMSVENYYQEIGRAGRDGKDSQCILYFSYSDKIMYEKLIRQNVGDPKSSQPRSTQSGKCLMIEDDDTDNSKKTSSGKTNKLESAQFIQKQISAYQSYQLNKLYDMVQYVDNLTDCRHVVLSNYFGENVNLTTAKCDDYCDNCNNNEGMIEEMDVSKESNYLCNIIIEISNKGMNPSRVNVINTFLGHSKYNNYSTSGFGLGKMLGKENSHRLLTYLISNSYAKEKLELNKYNYWIDILKLTKKAIDIIEDNKTIIMPIKKKVMNSDYSYFDKIEVDRLLMRQNKVKKDKVASSYLEEDKDLTYQSEPLYNDLNKFRSNFAKTHNMPIHHIYGEQTMKEIVKHKPQTLEELRNIYGIADKKIKKFGDELLHVIILGWDTILETQYN